MTLSRLKEVMEVQTKTSETKRMRRFIKKRLIEMGLKYESDQGNIYVTKGEAEWFPCSVCHIDTVHAIIDDFEVFERRGALYAMDMSKVEQYGIGGDDKVGVYITLELLHKQRNLKAVFFVDEERGCIGSNAAKMEFFDDVGYVLQCDRKGDLDFADEIGGQKLVTEAFTEKIKPIKDKWRRKSINGGMTDVKALFGKGLKCCSANMSCGYYNPHSSREVVIVQDVFNTLDFVKDLIKTLGYTFWEAPPKKVYTSMTPHTQNYGGGYNTSASWQSDPVWLEYFEKRYGPLADAGQKAVQKLPEAKPSNNGTTPSKVRGGSEAKQIMMFPKQVNDKDDFGGGPPDGGEDAQCPWCGDYNVTEDTLDGRKYCHDCMMFIEKRVKI